MKSVVTTQKGVEIPGSVNHKDLWGAVSLAQNHRKPNSASYMREEPKLCQTYDDLVFTILLQATAIHRIHQNMPLKKTSPSIS